VALGKRTSELCAPGAFALLLLLALPAAADEVPPGLHFEAAVRFGVSFQSFPDAEYAGEAPLDLTAYPIWVDAGLRVSHLLFVGAYFSYAPTTVSPGFVDVVSPCDYSCYARVFHFGLEVQLHPVSLSLGRGVSIDPWIGLGIGYEVAQERYDSEAYCTPGGSYCDVPHTGALQGPEWFNGQVGVAVAFDRFSIGPYFSASYGDYTSDAGQSFMSGVAHWWLDVGLRFTVTP
jgi:hypothetical protein